MAALQLPSIHKLGPAWTNHWVNYLTKPRQLLLRSAECIHLIVRLSHAFHSKRRFSFFWLSYLNQGTISPIQFWYHMECFRMEGWAVPDENESTTSKPLQPFGNVWSSAKGQPRLQIWHMWTRGKNGWDGKSIYLLIAWRNLKTLLLCLSSSNWHNRYTIFIKPKQKTWRTNNKRSLSNRKKHDRQTSFRQSKTLGIEWLT